MVTNFRSKLAKSAYSPLFITLAFQNGVESCNSDFKRFVGNDLATLCKNLVNVGPVTLEFMRGKGIHPLLINSLAMFAWLHHSETLR